MHRKEVNLLFLSVAKLQRIQAVGRLCSALELDKIFDIDPDLIEKFKKELKELD